MALKLKLEKVIGDFGSTLTRKHKHLVPAYSYREVTARWRNLTTLINLLDIDRPVKRLNVYQLSFLINTLLSYQNGWTDLFPAGMFSIDPEG